MILGCAMPEAEQGLNVARIASLRAGIPVTRVGGDGQPLLLVGPAGDCARRRSASWSAPRNVIVAGGTESMSLVPMGGHKIAPNPALVDSYPDVYLTTGLVAENHARESGITREEQDAFALRSHQRAVAAIDAGRFADEIALSPLDGRATRRRPRLVGDVRPFDCRTRGRGATRRSRRSRS